MTTLIIFGQAIPLLAAPFFFLYLIFEEHKKEKPSLLKQLFYFGFLAFYGGIAAPISAAVRAIAPWELLYQERTFFWNIFIELLNTTGTFSEACGKMLPRIPEVTSYIQETARWYKVCGLIFMIAGGAALAVLLLLLFRRGEKKSSPWLPVSVTALLFVLSVYGIHQYCFSSHIERRLNMYLKIRKEFLQEWSAKDQKLFRSNREIAEFLPRYLKENPRLFGDSQARLEPGVFKDKKQTP